MDVRILILGGTALGFGAVLLWSVFIGLVQLVEGAARAVVSRIAAAFIARAERRRWRRLVALDWPATLGEREFDRWCREYLQQAGWDISPTEWHVEGGPDLPDPGFYCIGNRAGRRVAIASVSRHARHRVARVARFAAFARSRGFSEAVVVCEPEPRHDLSVAAFEHGVTMIDVAGLRAYASAEPAAAAAAVRRHPSG